MGFYSLPVRRISNPSPHSFRRIFFGIMKSENLFTNTSFDLSEKDYAFAIELAKIGHVHFLSSQVVFKDERFGKKEDAHSISVPRNGTNVKGFTFPKNWLVEYIIANEYGISITFKVEKEESVAIPSVKTTPNIEAVIFSERKKEAISTIEGLYPPDSDYLDTRATGASLLQEAKEKVAFGWRNYPEDVLVAFAKICEDLHSRS